jgi:hypothetical protein
MGIAKASPLRTKGQMKDYFQTPEICVQALLNHITIMPGERILDPCCGNMPIGNVLRRNGYEIDEYDLYPEGNDFLVESYDDYDILICNPPYSMKNEFIRKAMTVAKRVYMILPMQVVNYNRFHREFLAIPEYEGRILMTPKFFMTVEYQVNIVNRGGISAYAWFHWQRQNQTPPYRSYESYVDLDEMKIGDES